MKTDFSVKQKTKSFIRTLVGRGLLLILFAAVYAFGVSCFLDPNNLAPGGVTGIAILVNRLVGIDTGTLIFLFNIPIMALSIWKFGFKFTASTIYTLAWISFFTNLFDISGAWTREPFLAAVAGGAINAVAIGMILRLGATTGGTDIVIKLLRNRYPFLKTGALFFIIDSIIVFLSLFVFGSVDTVLFTALTVFVTARVLDLVLYGSEEARMIFVISDEAETIARAFMQELQRGVTYLHGQGAYTGRDKKIMLCIMRKRQAPKAVAIIKDIDNQAFLIIASASEIYGEGYKDYYRKQI